MIYCFECNHCGHKAELSRPMKDCNKRAYCPKCRKLMCRDLGSEGGYTGRKTSGYPMESDAAGVHPDQIKEAMAFDRKHGVPTNYSKAGNPIYTSQGHRRRHCEANGLYDRNAGYGDAAPKNKTKAMNRGRNPKVRLARDIMAGRIPMPKFKEFNDAREK